MRIGEVARSAGISVDAVRFYERVGLLSKPTRSGGGFRLFTDADVKTLQFIRKAQGLGFSLQEIRELLLLRGKEIEACSSVRNRLGRKLIAVREKVTELRGLEKGLSLALRRCDRELKRGKRAAHCPVLEQSGAVRGKP